MSLPYHGNYFYLILHKKHHIVLVLVKKKHVKLANSLLTTISCHLEKNKFKKALDPRWEDKYTKESNIGYLKSIFSNKNVKNQKQRDSRLEMLTIQTISTNCFNGFSFLENLAPHVDWPSLFQASWFGCWVLQHWSIYWSCRTVSIRYLKSWWRETAC